MEDTYKMIINVLEDEMGYVLINDIGIDFDITDFIVDSIAFIQFALAIEEKIGFELTDDFLNYEVYKSIFGFAEKLCAFIQEKTENRNVD